MVENDNISKNYIAKLTEKNKKFYIEKGKYIMNFSTKLKNENDKFRCKFYKDKSKESINKTAITYDIKANNLFYNSLAKVNKRKKEYSFDDEDNKNEKDNNHINVHHNISPSFKNHKSALYRYINKDIPKDVDSLDEMPVESEYYKTIDNENYLAYKSDNMLIFMSKFQAQLLYKYNAHVFLDGTFYTAPNAAYQIVTVRIHDILTDNFYTVAYGILKDKTTGSYIEFLDNVKNYVYINRENKRNLEYNNPINIHSDFELSIINAIKQVYPSSEIKLCLWHFFRNIEINRNKIYGSIDNQTQESKNILKRIKTICFMDPNYIEDIFEYIEEDAKDDIKDQNFVKYFKTTYIEKYNIKYWNYFKIFDHRTNNACESYNHILNSKFNSKPSIWKFISVIRGEEELLRLEINRVREGEIVGRKKKKGIISFEKQCLKYYDNIDNDIKKIKNSNSENKEDLILNIWYNALLDFPIYDYNA